MDRGHSNSTLRKRIIDLCRHLHEKDLLASADGNISVRLSDEEILITPTAINKRFLDPRQIAVITLDNRVLEGEPSGERLMHLEVYRQCPKAKAVVHAHPPHAVAWSIAYPELRELPSEAMSEVILAVGRIPIVPYARPGTLEMGTVLTPHLPGCRVMILGRHGGLTWGETLDEAANGMERLEHAAKMLTIAHGLRSITALPLSEVEALREIRKRLGEQTR